MKGSVVCIRISAVLGEKLLEQFIGILIFQDIDNFLSIANSLNNKLLNIVYHKFFGPAFEHMFMLHLLFYEI